MKKIIQILIAVVTIISVFVTYNYFNTLNLSKLLSDDNKIFYLSLWTPSSDSNLLPVSSEREKDILDLIKEPIYYKESSESFIGDINVIRITIASSKNDSEVYYHYYISNTGKIQIINQDTQKGGFYSLERYPLLHDNKNSNEKELYNKLKQLIGENK